MWIFTPRPCTEEEDWLLQFPVEGYLEEEEGSSEAWLVGKLLTQGSFNSKAFMSTMTQIWKVRKGMEIREVGKNMFTFCFLERRDKDQILRGYQWSFEWKLIVLNE